MILQPVSLAICAIFKNEAPYLREWIEFHRIVGVERFHLYQNNSTDDWQGILRPYEAEGVVEVIDWPLAPPCQMQAYQHFIGAHKQQPGWVAFIDCDEFLFSPCHPTAAEALAAVALPEWSAVGVNWMCFGSSGQVRKTEEPVIERFTLRPGDSFGPNRHIKSIVRMDRVESAGLDPHHFPVKGGAFSESGREISGPLSPRPSHSLLRINHYHTKSREEYVQRIARGRADVTAPRSESEFDGYQTAEVDDTAIWRFLPALKERLADAERVGPSSDPQAPEPIAMDEAAASQSATVDPVGIEAAPKEAPKYAAFEGIDGALPRLLPKELAEYRGYHQGETVLVCGCGSSLSQVVAPERFTTIGVNDMGRLFHPDYLVVVNPRGQFSGDRFRYVESSQAKVVFTQLDLGISHPHIVRFQLGRRGGTDLSDGASLPYTRNSPYVALCLALQMGAKRVGLIGVDFTDHHFFGDTGRHPLSGELNHINNEYAALAHTCRHMGVEVFNLGANSRLTAFPKMSPQDFARTSLAPADAVASVRGRKVFFVNYRFLSCGEVFSDGLRNAAQDLAVQSASAYWDDGELPAKVETFAPDLLLVVHGRKYSQRWKSRLPKVPSAVWLLDEPYEVDDTSRFAQMFDTVFVNDPATLRRHKNAHLLPVCYDPAVYYYRPGPRSHRVGFIGGGNPAREQMLRELAGKRLLSYTVGGPWRDAEVGRLCLSPNIPAEQTADLYRQTQIVVNVFRTTHHYNRQQIPAVSMNPRIYEALACGALVISERRPEIERLCPELPTFGSLDEMVSSIEALLGDPARLESLRKACIRRLAGHTYAHRLHVALAATLGQGTAYPWKASSVVGTPSAPREQPADTMPEPARPAAVAVLPGWEADPACAGMEEDGVILLHTDKPQRPGSEVGLIGAERYGDVRLGFEVRLDPGAMFLAKIHQAEQRNQSSNSYHLMGTGPGGYVARHSHVFRPLALRHGVWETVAMSYARGTLSVGVNGKVECQSKDDLLPSGYCFLGVKAGTARLRNVTVAVPTPQELPVEVPAPDPSSVPPHDVSYDNHAVLQPDVSIVTTVYDRVECLDWCIQSVQALNFDRYEHIIVADAPPSPVTQQIQSLVEKYDDGRHRLRFAVLRSRANDWGISPAAAGLSMACGKYVCFLSDDNGYKPEHFEKLVAALDAGAALGFAYSGCLYGGRAVLNSAPPAPARIDLGQPLFRRELFHRYLGGAIPFREFGWDWKIIQRFMQNGVAWKHVRDATFIFRLAQYPHLKPPARPAPSATPAAAISYCVACYRPVYARQLIDDLIAKTSALYEILIWMNLEDRDFEDFLAQRSSAGAPIRILGRTPENIGMAAYPRMFSAARFDMVAQIDDDVVCISPGIAEIARATFDRFPKTGMITADVCQDKHTNGARPPMEHYKLFDQEAGLYDGPIDGWFAIYRRASLTACRNIRPGRYFCLGSAIKNRLKSIGQCGVLCTRMKVFHVTNPHYAAHFGMLDAEIDKYRLVGREDMVKCYSAARDSLPLAAELAEGVLRIRQELAGRPGEA